MIWHQAHVFLGRVRNAFSKFKIDQDMAITQASFHTLKKLPRFPRIMMIPTLSTCYDPRRKARGNTLAATKALTRASPVVVQAVHGRAEALVAILN